MKIYKGNKTSKVESVAQSVYRFIRFGLDLCVSIFMLLILVVMPFYNEEGYTHIGTDKATFFRQCIIYGSKILIPLLVITVIFGMIVFVQENGLPDWRHFSCKDTVAAGKKMFSVTDYFACLYAFSVLISYCFTNYKEEALWGTAGWFMGMLPQLAAVAIYFLVSRAWKARVWMTALVLPVSAVVFGLGYLNRFGIYPIDMRTELPGFISTIGNINWYCGYLVCVFFGGMFVAWKVDWEKWWQKLLLLLYVAVGFATLATQGSASGIVTMMVMFLLLFWMSASDGKRMEMFWLEMVLFSFMCLITYLLRATQILKNTFEDTIIDLLTYSPLTIIMTIVSFVFWIWVFTANRRKQYPLKIFKWLTRAACGGAAGIFGLYILLLIVNTVGNGFVANVTSVSLEGILTFTPKWGNWRGATWMCGLKCFEEQAWLHKLVGVGPDCIAAFLYNDGSETLVNMAKEYFGKARLTNAHNEWLTVLINMGILGFVGFVGMMTSAIKRYIHNRNVSMMAAACGICVLAYTINNMFSFQQSMSLATIFTILGMGENYLRNATKQSQ